MQDGHVKLNPGLPWKKQHLRRSGLFSPGNWKQFKEETSEMPHLEHNFFAAETWTLRKIHDKYFGSLNVVLETVGDHLYRSCEI